MEIEEMVDTKALTAVDTAVTLANNAFHQFKVLADDRRIAFFNELISVLDGNRTAIIYSANLETNLPLPRLENEFNRTINQIKLFIDTIKDKTWREASIDYKTDKANTVLIDIRKINVALGPVAVFSASNFPLAFSVAGNDTIAAFAAGCPVIVKAHNGHPATSKLVAASVLHAGEKCNLPKGFFSILFDEGYSVGLELVRHPLVKAVGFTGSYSGGMALIAEANKRKEPIPVYAEMGSLNPVLLLPDTLEAETDKLAKMFAGSITQGSGQFCTKPGLFFSIKGKGLDGFIEKLKAELSGLTLHPMLNEQIKQGFKNKLETKIIKSEEINYYKTTDSSDQNRIGASIAIVSATDFINNENLREEFFGPFAIIVKCKNRKELTDAVSILNGQLTATIIGTESELNLFSETIDLLKNKVGRILFNGVPTGVEVCYSMQHGGPFPASSTPQFTSIGADAIKRFVRPLCFQACPQSLLPQELQNENPGKTLRRINGKYTTKAILAR